MNDSHLSSQQNSSTARAELASGRRALHLLTLLYVGLIVYGSLYPLTGWTVPSMPVFSFLTAAAPEHSSRADLLTNVLAYVPLGVLLLRGLRLPTLPAIAVATMLGGCLSFAMESVQVFLPARTASNIDLLNNVIGTLLGACLGLVLRGDGAVMPRLKTWRDEWFAEGRGVDLGIFAVLLWSLSQLSPFVPSMDVSSVRQGLGPLWHTLSDPATLSLLKTLAYGLNIAGLAFLVSILSREGRRASLLFLLFVAGVLAAKPFIVSRELSLEALCGLGLGAVMLALAPRKPALRALLSMACIFSGFAVAEVTPSAGGFHAFSWIPFAGQIDNTIGGFGSILEDTWPFVALASLVVLGFGNKVRPMLYGAGVFVTAAFTFEWLQQQIPGRYGDVTPVILAGLAWLVACAYARSGRPTRKEARSLRRSPQAIGSP